jgi:precorrin-2 dehydrogenase/sirohydrochlorin ferrochelatase
MYYPIHLQLADMKITIIGGGKIALRKCQFFRENEKPVTVVAKAFIPEFKEFQGPGLELIQDEYCHRYIDDSFLVIAVTDDTKLNGEIGAYCRARQKLVNVASDASLSNFIIPGVVQRGELLMSVSTSGRNPSLAKEIKEQLHQQYGPEYAEMVANLPRIKKK